MTGIRPTPFAALTLAAALVGVMGFLACAGRGLESPSLMAWSPPRGQECHWSPGPAVLPTANALVDSAAVMAVVGRTMPDESGYVVVSVAFDSTGAARTPRLVETTLSGELATSFLDGLEPLIRPQDGSVRMLLRAEPSGVQVGRSLVCRPYLINKGEVQAAMTEAMGRRVGLGTGTIRPLRPAVLWLFVDTTGAVTRVRLHEQSGVAAWDQIALESTDLMRFHPARDNVLVPVWATVSLTVGEADDHRPSGASPRPARGGLPPRE